MLSPMSVRLAASTVLRQLSTAVSSLFEHPTSSASCSAYDLPSALTEFTRLVPLSAMHRWNSPESQQTKLHKSYQCVLYFLHTFGLSYCGPYKGCQVLRWKKLEVW